MNNKRLSFISFPKELQYPKSWLECQIKNPDKGSIFSALNYVTETQLGKGNLIWWKVKKSTSLWYHDAELFYYQYLPLNSTCTLGSYQTYIPLNAIPESSSRLPLTKQSLVTKKLTFSLLNFHQKHSKHHTLWNISYMVCPTHRGNM